MRKIKFLTLIFLILFIFLMAISCAKQEEPSKDEKKEAEKPNLKQATYVGTEKCSSCHSGIEEMVESNSHGTAFKPLENYNVNSDASIIIYEDIKEGEAKSFKLSEAKIAGVMSDHYVIGLLNGKYYRVAAVHKENENWKLKPAAAKDINNDGKEDWLYKSYTCGDCHSPGLAVDPERKTDLEPGFNCESCHGPGSIHVTTKSKKAIDSGKKACLNCHTASEPEVKGDILIAQNHYGTRNWFDSNHNNGKPSDCLNCHTSHKVNVEGKMIKEDSAKALCSSCHGDSVDPEKIMWVNPTDPYNHFTKDHSFDKYPYDVLGDDPETKTVEISNPEIISKMKKKLK